RVGKNVEAEWSASGCEILVAPAPKRRTAEAADIEAGPVDRNRNRRRRSLGDKALPDRGRKLGGRKLIAKSAIDAPAVDVLAGAEVAADIAEPTRVGHLTGNAQGKLAVSPDSARGQTSRKVGTHAESGLTARPENRGYAGVKIGGDGISELVEDARRYE